MRPVPAEDPNPSLSLALPSPDATRALAAALAGIVGPGDALLLSGPVGAGKSVLARALIQALQHRAGGPVEEVPSPSFTLVQEYRAGELEIWHCDLYRLGDAGEMAELGIDEALGRALVIVEWPERAAAAFPDTALRITLSLPPATADDSAETRRAAISAPPERLHALSDALDAATGGQ